MSLNVLIEGEHHVLNNILLNSTRGMPFMSLNVLIEGEHHVLNNILLNSTLRDNVITTC